MRNAVIDIAGELLPEVAKVLTDHGLKFTGTMQYGFREYDAQDMLRLIVCDEFNQILPEQCNAGWWLISVTFTIEAYGTQRITKISAIDVVGKLEFTPNGVSRLAA